MAKKSKGINKIHREAIRLRYEGSTQDEMVERLAAQELKTTVNTIEGWFRAGGLLETEYEKYCHEQEQIESRIEKVLRQRAQHIMKGAVKTAAEMLTALMGSERDEVKLKAAIKIIEQEFGKAVQPISGYLTYEQAIKQLEREEEEYKRELAGKN